MVIASYRVEVWVPLCYLMSLRLLRSLFYRCVGALKRIVFYSFTGQDVTLKSSLQQNGVGGAVESTRRRSARPYSIVNELCPTLISFTSSL